MSDNKIPPEVLEALDGCAAEEMAKIVQWGKGRRDLWADGRREGQINAKKYADNRRLCIVATAIQIKTEYPYLTELGVIDNVIAKLHEKVQRKEKGFRVLKASTIIHHLKAARFLDSEGFFRRDESL